ncbi:hypothetical protein [Nonomuraea gerenzanensis]|uniref:Uncharacterized protein n=1 Tax=Nonomuraea gerenzanensis TaxID=93944 RepID=A0A1M4E2W3_9ACTN|nr:hypothetical protein [Nonomuraea gerenzanensis]UBU15441.1 hypothetical protein LCN96_10580 [Nonomuraea gerenzanensis]SBO93198.1 hypothetical protein BN4615_P2712 [Nonomuraea gerenzanensis]
MRTWFEPQETEEYEAARTVLIRRCLAWADEHGRPADAPLLRAALDARHRSRDGRLAYWDEPQIRRYLLGWIPKYVVTPREILEIAPEILRTFLHYLAATGLRDPRGATPAQADDAIIRALPDFRAALDDPSLQGLAKFWAQTALDHGNDLAGPGALRDFQLDLDAGRIRYDQELLDRLLRARCTRTDLDLEEERGCLPPPVALPAPADLAEAAARSTTVRRLVALATWAGEVGRPLTRAGDLTLADARELSILLGTGEEQLQVRGSAGLPRLSLLLAWARRLGLVRVSRGRLCRVARAAPLLRDPSALWARAFDALPHLITAGGHTECFDQMLDALYGMRDVPVARVAELVWLTCQEHTARDGTPERIKDLRRRWAAVELDGTLEMLADLGAVDLTRGPPDEQPDDDRPLPPDALERLRARLAEPDLLLARLTPLALAHLRDRLLAQGHDAPLIGELATAPPAELLGVLFQHYPPREAAVELNAWLSRPGQDLEVLLRAIRDCPFRTRAAAMLAVLAEVHPQGAALVRALRHDHVLAATALTLLVDAGEVDPATLDRHEHLLLGAENFLTLLELGGARVLIDQLRSMAGDDAYELATAVLTSGHHDVTGLEELRELVAQPLRERPLRLIPGTGQGTRRSARRRRRS